MSTTQDKGYASGYQAALRDIRLALATGGEAAVREWIANNLPTER